MGANFSKGKGHRRACFDTRFASVGRTSMMLKLAGIAEPRSYLCEANEYVPLRIEFEPRVVSLDETYYWRSTDRNYLLEVKVHAADGALAEIGLILVPEERTIQLESISELDGISERKNGLPCFEITPWTDRIGHKEIGIDPALRRYDEECPFRYFHANHGVAILFDGCTPDRVVANKKVLFLFNATKELCGIIAGR
jgi:hypothetical protein